MSSNLVIHFSYQIPPSLIASLIVGKSLNGVKEMLFIVYRTQPSLFRL